MIKIYNPEFLIIWETWLDHKPTLFDNRYEVFQTWFKTHQGVWIIAKKNSVIKMITNNDPYIIWVQSRNEKSEWFVIGAYFKENAKGKILDRLKHLINRIRKTHPNTSIFLFGDFNLWKNFNINLIETSLKLKVDERNKNLITRMQNTKGELKSSTLDLFISTEQFETIETLDKNSSDHFPILISTKIPSKKQIKIKTLKIVKRKDIGVWQLNEIMKNKNWPTKADPAKIKRIFQERITIRPTVKLQEKANIIFSIRQEWESKETSLKTLWNENFKKYVKDLYLYRKTDSKKFYQIIQSLLKYKNKGKLVKGINE